jgi:hypothetical protein
MERRITLPGAVLTVLEPAIKTLEGYLGVREDIPRTCRMRLLTSVEGYTAFLIMPERHKRSSTPIMGRTNHG